jgi:hypothetical protein
MSKLAPVILFCYNRLIHLQKTIESLKKNKESIDTDIYIYCDGPRINENRANLEEVHNYVRKIEGFKSIKYIFSDKNYGLSRSVIKGITEVLTEFNSVIVIEDDLVVSPYFLKYMNEGLKVFENDENVASIHGYCYPVNERLPDNFFLRGADCWGWATWSRAWKNFEKDGIYLLNELKNKNLIKQFNMSGAYPFTKMLEDNVKGKNDSWAIRWHASCFLKNMLTLYPGISLVNNIGMDKSGTHSGLTNEFDQNVAVSPINIGRIDVTENIFAREIIANFLRDKTSILNKLKRLINRIRIF